MATITLEDELNISQDEPSSIEGMTAFCSPNVNEVSTQVKYKSEMYRSRFDFYLSLCQHNARPRSIAVSRTPATIIKASCILQQEKQCAP